MRDGLFASIYGNYIILIAFVAQPRTDVVFVFVWLSTAVPVYCAFHGGYADGSFCYTVMRFHHLVAFSNLQFLQSFCLELDCGRVQRCINHGVFIHWSINYDIRQFGQKLSCGHGSV